MALQVEERAPAKVTGPMAVVGDGASSLFDVLTLRPGWPLAVLFVGFPLWWALGLTDVVTFIAVAAMAVELFRLRKIRVPANFGIWLLFLVWVALGVAVVQVDVPGAVSGSSSTRYLTWAWRLLWYVKATVVLLYIGNQRGRLSSTWVCRVFGWMFVWIVAGGVLGVLKPTFQFRSLVEMLLPKSLLANSFVYSKVHPIAAEAHLLLGQAGGRTSAPFAYANVWGFNFACFLPFFVLACFGRDAGWRRIAGTVVLAVSVVPVVYSLNRGLWGALVGAAMFTAVRSAFGGRLKLLMWLGGGLVVGALAIAISPLGSAIGARLDNSAATSNAARTNLLALGLGSTTSTSPVIGFGTTRDVQGNFNSIAGGATALCPRCSSPPLGTQGQFSLVSFTQGIVGAVLYFGFLTSQLLRYVRVKEGAAVAVVALLLMHFITAAAYSADNLGVLAIFALLALGWRAQLATELAGRPDQLYSARERTVRDQFRLLRAHGILITVTALVGLLAGAFVAFTQGRNFLGSASVSIPAEPSYRAVQQHTSRTLDTVAQLAHTTSTLDAMRSAVGPNARVELDRLSVTATPNTTLLHLSYSAATARTARLAADAAARAVLRQDAEIVATGRRLVVGEVRNKITGLRSALAAIGQASGKAPAVTTLSSLARSVTTQLVGAQADLAAVERTQPDPDIISAPTTVRLSHDGRRIDLASGLGIGLLLGALASAMLGLRNVRLRSRRRVSSLVPLPLLARGSVRELDVDSIRLFDSPTGYVPVGTSADCAQVARLLDSSIDRSTGYPQLPMPPGVVLVAGRRDRVQAVLGAQRSMEACGAQIAGLIIVE